jgi:DHA2 family multidrug resistance protein
MVETSPKPTQTLSTNPILGIAGVLLGATIATFLGRLISVGIGDLRGALHLDYDSSTWISTAYNMGLMFIGPFSVFLGALIGARRVLLSCAAMFALLCAVMPFASHLSILLVLIALAGLTAGTFYPLTLAFILRSLPRQYMLYGIAVYGADAMVTVYLAHSYEAWMIVNLSWRWIFWTSVILTMPMIVCIFFGIPATPIPASKSGQSRPSWNAFLYGSTGGALLYGALDQGQHLDWWRSGTFVGMVLAGCFLLIASTVSHFQHPNPLVKLPFLRRRNTMLLAATLFFFRFILLATVVVLPAYLANVQGYSAEQIGSELIGLALPQLLAGFLAILLLERIDSRVILAVGLGMCGFGCVMSATLSPMWSGANFQLTQVIFALGEGLVLNGLIGSLLLDVLNSGSMDKGMELLTFSGFFQVVRLIGGELGTSFMVFFLQNRERFHASALNLHAKAGASSTTERLQALGMGMQAQSATPDTAAGRAAELFVMGIHKQAFTLAANDCFLLIALSCVVCLVIVSCIGSLNIQYKHLIAAIKAQRA